MPDPSTIREEARASFRGHDDYARSPFPPWSAEDLAWLAGCDDASGDYPDAASATPSPGPASGEDSEQLDLF